MNAPSAPDPAARSEPAIALLLCAVAGYADAVGYLQMGVFAANMTGNSVLLAIGLAQAQWALSAERAVTVGCFFAGAVLGRVLLRLAGQRPSAPLLAEALLLGAALWAEPQHVLSLWLMAAAMGVQASAMTRFNGAALSTVVMTSTLARLAHSVADALVAPFGMKPPAGTEPVSLLLGTWASYAAGAVAAALLMPVMANPLALACAMLLALSSWLGWQGRAAARA
jgi:uncharacterized membrane protein YoaK (UPF0700 family)